MNEYKNRKASDNKRYNYKIMRIINEIGFENFSYEIIDVAFTSDELSKKEEYYIRKLNTFDQNYGYNSRLGDLKSPLNTDTRRRMSISHTGLKESSETKRKKSKRVIAFKDGVFYIAGSAKLFGDYIGKGKDMVSHAIVKGMKIAGYYVFHLDDKEDKTYKYTKLKDKKYLELYKLVRKGVEIIEKSYEVKYILYD